MGKIFVLSVTDHEEYGHLQKCSGTDRLRL